MHHFGLACQMPDKCNRLQRLHTGSFCGFLVAILLVCILLHYIMVVISPLLSDVVWSLVRITDDLELILVVHYDTILLLFEEATRFTKIIISIQMVPSSYSIVL